MAHDDGGGQCKWQLHSHNKLRRSWPAGWPVEKPTGRALAENWRRQRQLQCSRTARGSLQSSSSSLGEQRPPRRRLAQTTRSQHNKQRKPNQQHTERNQIELNANTSHNHSLDLASGKACRAAAAAAAVKARAEEAEKLAVRFSQFEGKRERLAHKRIAHCNTLR